MYTINNRVLKFMKEKLKQKEAIKNFTVIVAVLPLPIDWMCPPKTHTIKYYLCIKEMNYNMNKHYKHYPKWTKITKKCTLIPFIWNSRIKKSIETESGLVVSWGWNGEHEEIGNDS